MSRRRKRRRRICNKINEYITLLMKISVIIAVILGLFQLNQNDRAEKRRIAIEAVRQTRTVEFIKALTRLKKGCENRKIDDNQAFRDDLNFVMSVYDNIAILYLNDIVDKRIIKNAVKSGLNDFMKTLDSISDFPFEYRESMDSLKTKLNQ